MDKLDADYIGLRIAIPYPGCIFRSQAEKNGRILTNDFSKYRDDNVVFIPKGLEGYNIKNLRDIGEAYFYRTDNRRNRIRNQGFDDLYNSIMKYDRLMDKPLREIINDNC
jgi:hypothetical protein